MRNIVFTAFLVLQIFSAQSQTKNFIDQPYIEVNGAVDTLITPNEIFIKIVISEKDTRDRTSVEELEDKMVAALKALGVNTEKELTINDMASNFRFYLLKNKDVLKSKQYLLKVTDAVTAGKVFMQLEDLGISNVSVDRVDHSDLENIRNIMRSRAVENAKARAVALTKPLNQTIGVAINIVDNANYVTGIGQGRLDEVVVVGYGSQIRNQQEPPKIEFEKIKVTTNINVKFVLK